MEVLRKKTGKEDKIFNTMTDLANTNINRGTAGAGLAHDT
jgi:hypothetical protein